MTSLSVADLAGDHRRMRRERLIRRLFGSAAAVSVVVTAAIVVSLVWEARAFLGSVQLGSLWELGWYPRRGLFDIRTLVVGTLLVTVIAMFLAVPLGLGAAIYLSEYARPAVRRIAKPVLEVLAGIPSVVIGFFALVFISPNIVLTLSPLSPEFNLAAAGLGVGILVIPLVASISEDAMGAVPAALREAAYGLGARRVTTSVRVVVPAAISGIVAALILATSRAIGETMVVAIAAGGSGGALFTLNPFDPGQTMTGAMASLAAGTDQVRGASNAFQSLFFVGLVLFAVTLGLNVVADRFVTRVREQY